MKKRQNKKRATNVRERVVREATRLIAERGFGAIALQDVADAVGTSKQALLYHFPSREALKRAVIDQLVTRANEDLSRLMNALAESPGDLDPMVEHLESRFNAEPHGAAVFLRFLLDGDQEAVRRIRRETEPWLRAMVAWLRRGQRAARVRPELDVEAAVVQVGALVLTNFALLPIHGWTRDPPRAWRRRRLAEMMRAIRSVLFMPAAPKRRQRSARAHTAA